MTWVIAGAGILLLVFFHELGHFSVALALRMRPRSFYIGFPPAIAKVRRNGIEYGIGMIPLGGFVRIPGMHRPSADDLRAFIEPAVREDASLEAPVRAVRRALDAEDFPTARAAYPELERAVESARLSSGARRSARRALRDVEEGTAPDAYWRAPTWKRISVIAAGPAANVLIAFLILFAVFAVSGAPTNTARVVHVDAGKPAATAGLRGGDSIVAVDGTPATFATIAHLIRSSRGAPVTVTVIRNGRRLTLGPQPTVLDGGRWIWGFTSAQQLRREPVGTAASRAASGLWHVVTGTVSGIGALLTRHSGAHLSGPITIVRVGHAELQHGFTWYLGLLALVSMSLALFNLLPLLPLDGGHILFSLIEGVRRRALAREVYERVSLVGVALILFVLLIAYSNGSGSF